ncbi:phage antirepressor KilAC domain-containing protein [Cellulomonas sp. ACRRI]|uniref:phage antirepressor KilAC domain-containing protein n=1 Tax=Cellulomonas sp. ACRRI TaxID=2918188 RepID=UPI001EF31D0D|nr:phage antirepressor KilAC domain-containing protein [Cellulomonas sp. ACRRI]MCG7285397.1 phage antirepressor KilAC domain-containing protein [Cellulomonas sp. ACRRI]
MTTDLIQHAFHGQAVRTITDEHGDPWFVATDVAKILGYAAAKDMTRRLDDDEKGGRSVPTPGGVQSVTVISEAGLYSSILGSRVDGAKAFKRWVTHELLPEVRRTGSYSLPKDYPSALRALAAEAETRAALQAKVEQDAPKVLFADAVATTSTDVLVSHLAVILKANGVDVGSTRLFGWLRRDGYLCSREGRDWNRPTQKAMDLGLFRVKETAVTHSDGRVTTSVTPAVTGKGQTYFVNRYAGVAVAS